jgi:hypothetical protein
MSEPSSAIDLLTLEAMSKDQDARSANRRLLWQQEYSRLRQGEEAAWKLLAAVTRLSQVAGECQWSNVPFDPNPYAGPLVEAFSEVCDVMRANHLGSELDQLDEEQMIAQDKPPALARSGYQTAVTALREGISKGTARSWKKLLGKTLESSAGRHLWYMAYPIVRGLLVGDHRLFRKTETALLHESRTWNIGTCLTVSTGSWKPWWSTPLPPSAAGKVARPSCDSSTTHTSPEATIVISPRWTVPTAKQLASC